MASARARATRCCWPPESWWAYWSACVVEPDEVEHLGGAGPARWRGRDAAQLEPELDVLPRGHVREQAVRLEHHPHVALVGGHPGEVLAADLDAARVGVLEAGEAAQRRGLAAARGAEQGDELARARCAG